MDADGGRRSGGDGGEGEGGGGRRRTTTPVPMSPDLFETLRGISRDVLEVSREVGGFRADVARELGGVQERLDRLDGQIDKVKGLSEAAVECAKDVAVRQHEHERRLTEVEKTAAEASMRFTGLRAVWTTVAAVVTVGSALTIVILRLVGRF